MEIKKSDHVQSLEKGLNVLIAFSGDRKVMTISEVADVTGLTRAAARRFLLTYTSLGYVYSDGKNFELTSKVLSLGYAYLSSLEITDIAKPYMLRLSNLVNESTSIATIDKNDVVYLMRQQVSRIMTINLGIGTRLPAHVTSMGRIIMAMNDVEDEVLGTFKYEQHTINTIVNKHDLKEELLKIKEQGWALVDQELEAGVRSISAPIFSKDGTVKFAMNIGCQSNRVSRDKLINDFLPHLLEVTSEITNALKKI